MLFVFINKHVNTSADPTSADASAPTTVSDFMPYPLLLHSLGMALSQFPSVAGRVKARESITCNNQGVMVIEARCVVRELGQNHSKQLNTFACARRFAVVLALGSGTR